MVIEYLDAVRLIDDPPAGVTHGLSVLVQLGDAPPQHGPHLGQKLSFGTGLVKINYRPVGENYYCRIK